MYLVSIIRGFRLVNEPTPLDLLPGCLFSPKCQRISINFSENHIFGVGMRESSDAISLLPLRDSQRHHGGGGVREGCDTVESWSRGAEPFLLMDHLWKNPRSDCADRTPEDT